MALTGWLIDKTALVRLQTNQAEDRDMWSDRIQRGLVRLSTITRLEIGYSARSGEGGRRELASPPLSLMPLQRVTPAIEDRAFEVQMLLGDRGQHRAPSIPDLLIAASAEKLGLTVLAVDKDFELIAELTGQSVEALTLRSSV